MPYVPVEIWWKIIECLRGDFVTLLACAQVCHRWRKRILPLLPDERLEYHNREEVAFVAKRRGQGPSEVKIIGGEGAMQKWIPHLGTFATMLAGKWRRVEALYVGRPQASLKLAPKFVCFV